MVWFNPRIDPMKNFPVLMLLLSVSVNAAERPVPADHAERMERGVKRFRETVKGVLNEHCVKCHGGEKTKGDFDLTTREDLLRGGAEGVAVVPFDVAGSRLLKLVKREEEPHMPGTGPALSAEAVGALEAWIADGAAYDGPLVAGKKPARDKSAVSAEDRQWWAFRPLAKVEVPGAGHPVDAFIVKKAAEKGLGLTVAAGPEVMLRRAFLVLTGLPPSPEEIAAYAAAPTA